jgi:hypothetical protein
MQHPLRSRVFSQSHHEKTVAFFSKQTPQFYVWSAPADLHAGLGCQMFFRTHEQSIVDRNQFVFAGRNDAEGYARRWSVLADHARRLFRTGNVPEHFVHGLCTACREQVQQEKDIVEVPQVRRIRNCAEDGQSIEEY